MRLSAGATLRKCLLVKPALCWAFIFSALTSVWAPGAYPTPPVRLVGGLVSRMSPNAFATLGNALYFTLETGTGSDLYRTDGTVSGTVRVLSTDRLWSPLASMGGNLYFWTYNDSQTLWKSDGIGPQAVQLTDLPQLSDSIRWMASVGGKLFSCTGFELWVTDGTEGGTRSLVFSGGMGGQAVIGDTLFFTSWGVSSETKGLWKSDGTPEGTMLVKQIDFANRPSRYLVVVNGRVCFVVLLPDGGPVEFWQSDGTSAGTTQFAEFILNNYSESISFSTPMNGWLYFALTNADRFVEIWKTNGTSFGTTKVKTWNDVAYIEGEPPVPVGNTLYFTMGRTDLIAYKDVGQLWRSDGTDAGTQLVKEFSLESFLGDAYQLWIQDLGAEGNALFFSAAIEGFGDEPWRTEGTDASTSMLTDLFPGPGGSKLAFVANLNGKKFFSARDSDLYEYSLFVHDATPRGAAFSATPRLGEVPAEIHFFDDSDLGWNASTAWVWDFGDGQTSAEQNPTHIYTEEDAYTVSLTVTSADGIGHIAKPLYVDIGHKLPVTGNSACIILATFVALCGAGFSLRTSRRRLP